MSDIHESCPGNWKKPVGEEWALRRIVNGHVFAWRTDINAPDEQMLACIGCGLVFSTDGLQEQKTFTPVYRNFSSYDVEIAANDKATVSIRVRRLDGQMVEARTAFDDRGHAALIGLIERMNVMQAGRYGKLVKERSVKKKKPVKPTKKKSK